MVKRKELVLGLVYIHDENWIGGTYYIQNIISALALLPEEIQPSLKIICYTPSEFEDLKARTGYLKMSPVFMVYHFLPLKMVNKLFHLFFKRSLFVPKADPSVDIIFPAKKNFFLRRFKRPVAWIPDFQELSYPEFFSQEILTERRSQNDITVADKTPIILSSEHAYSNFKSQYKQANNRVYVLPFAVSIAKSQLPEIRILKAKFAIRNDYFICSNQFWAHKNHNIVLKAFKAITKTHPSLLLVLTGKPFDNRNPNYVQSLIDFIDDNGLKERVLFLGFIDRMEQLSLMKNSLAIIQPSLFEGWSTVVEDAKALAHPVVASSIFVHKEQLGNDYPFLFDPDNEDALAQLMLRFTAPIINPLEGIEYSKSVEKFGRNFLDIMLEEMSYSTN